MIRAIKHSNGIIFVLIKKAKPTNEQSFEKQKGTLAVMTIIKTKSSQSERKKNPIFLVILFIIFLSLFWLCGSLRLPLTCRRFTKLRIFNTFVYRHRQNLVSKITNSDKSKTPQFREASM